jgi:hypothetical protein
VHVLSPQAWPLVLEGMCTIFAVCIVSAQRFEAEMHKPMVAMTVWAVMLGSPVVIKALRTHGRCSCVAVFCGCDLSQFLAQWFLIFNQSSTCIVFFTCVCCWGFLRSWLDVLLTVDLWTNTSKLASLYIQQGVAVI